MNILAHQVFKPLDIDISTSNYHISKIIEQIRDNKLSLFPDYSIRRSPWHRQKQSSFIESILARIPIPSIYIDRRDDDNWKIIDGNERLCSIANFCVFENLHLSGLNYFPDFEGYTFPELPGNLQRRIEETIIIAHEVSPGVPDDVYDNIFNRIRS